MTLDTAHLVLQMLQESGARPLSGKEIGSKLHISRTAVWKAVRKLKLTGYEVEAVARQGYRLSGSCGDILSYYGILSYLTPETSSKLNLEVKSLVSSTHDLLDEKARVGDPAGTCIVAAQQERGRGRRGHSFYSPPGGVYISLLLRPPALRINEGRWLTVIAANAACEAIDKILMTVPGEHPRAQIKWLNDIYLGERKVCGILNEARCELESDLIDYVLCGAGFNLYAPTTSLPSELQNLMGAILPQHAVDGKNRLTAHFLTAMQNGLAHFEKESCAAAFKARSNLIGKRVLLEGSHSTCEARVLDIDEECRLQVRFKDGTRAALQGGHVSLISS